MEPSLDRRLARLHAERAARAASSSAASYADAGGGPTRVHSAGTIARQHVDQQLMLQQMSPPPPPERPLQQPARPQPSSQQPWPPPAQRPPPPQGAAPVQPTQSRGSMSPGERLISLRRSAAAIRAASVLSAPRTPSRLGVTFAPEHSGTQFGSSFETEPKATQQQHHHYQQLPQLQQLRQGGGDEGPASLSTPDAARASALEDEILFRKLDTNSSGQLSLDETLQLIPTIGLVVSEKYIEGVWSMYDSDGSGELSREEFGRLMHVLRRKHDAVRTPGSMRSPRPPAPSLLPTRPQSSTSVTVANPLASASRSDSEETPTPRPRFSPRGKPTPRTDVHQGTTSAASMLADLDALQISTGEHSQQDNNVDPFSRAHAAAQQMDWQRLDLEPLQTPSRLGRQLEPEPEREPEVVSGGRSGRVPLDRKSDPQDTESHTTDPFAHVIKSVIAAKTSLNEAIDNGTLSERIECAGRLHDAVLQFRAMAASGVIKAAVAQAVETRIEQAMRSQQDEYTKIVDEIDRILARAARLSMGDEWQESVAVYQKAMDHYSEVLAADIAQQSDIEAIQRRMADAKQGIDRARGVLPAQLGSDDGSPETDSDDEADLVGAFEACDEDNSGKIDAAELYAILRAVGSDITLSMTHAVIQECETLFEEQANITASIRACPMFANLADRQIAKLVRYMEKVQYSSGQAIIREGDTGAEMFMVETGVCAVTKEGVRGGAQLRKYEAGDTFGERALLDSAARSASVTAISPQVTLRKLSAATYKKLLRGNPLLNKQLNTQRASYSVALLRSVAFIRSSLNDDQVSEIAAAVIPQEFREGDVVVREFEEGDCMYIVESGSLAVTKGDTGTVNTLLEGDYFGEVALMNKADNRRNATVTASSRCRLLTISKDTFDSILLNKKAQKEVRKRIVDYNTGRPAVNKMSMQGLAQTLGEGIDGTVSVAQLGAGKARKLADDTTRIGLDNTRKVFEMGQDVTKGIVQGSLNMVGFITNEDGSLSPTNINGDWRDRVGLIRKLRRAYDMADVDGDNELQKRELEIVLLSLDPSGSITDADIGHVWDTLNPEGKKVLTWGDFLVGMGCVHTDPRAAAVMNKNAPNKFALISLLIDIKVSAREERKLMEDMSFLEKFGMRSLRKMQKDMSHDEAKQVLRKAANGQLRKLDVETQGSIVGHQVWVAFQALFIAIVTNGLPGLWENYLTWSLQTDGVFDTYQSNNCILETKNATIINNITLIEAKVVTVCQELSPLEQILEFWASLIPVVVLCIVAEILLLGIAAVRASCHIASEYNFRLTPLNKERHFVATALIRACFEMGNAPQRSYGVNPDAEPELESMKGKKLKVIVKLAFYKAKGFVMGFVIKQIFAIFFTVQTLTWLNPYAPGLSACFWDTMITVVIMQRVVMTANGVVTGTEVFNELMDELPSPMSKLGQLMVLRAIGVAVVLEGTMLPTMELLLRHAVQYFNLKGSSLLHDPDVELDSLDRFKSGLKDLPEHEQTVVLCVMLLTEMFDGDIDPVEFEVWQEITKERHATRGVNTPHVEVNEYALQHVARDFRNRKFITSNRLREAIAPGAEGKKEREFWHKASSFLLQ